MPKKHWLPADIETLKRLYPDQPAQFVANVLGCDLPSVYRKAASLGITKSEAFLASDMSGRVQRGKQDPRLTATQFKAGQSSWNKGIKGSAGLHENSRKTQFKPRTPEESRNYRPIGSLRITKDGYLERKVTNDHPVPARRWVAVHRLVWEATNGPLPKGHIVRFKEGLKTATEPEVTLDRLECVSRSEHLKRNHPRSRDPELGKLIQLKGAITRQLNRITKEAKANEQPSHQ